MLLSSVKMELAWIAMMLALGATPIFSLPSLPAAMPATWVPCAQAAAARLKPKAVAAAVQSTPEPLAVDDSPPSGQAVTAEWGA